MKSIKPIAVLMMIVALITVLIPAVLVLPFYKEGQENGALLEEHPSTNKEQDDALQALNDSKIEVAVLRHATQKTEKLPLEKYVAGVVAAEMPATFELEALKAQALTARTFIIDSMVRGGSGDLQGADVSDTVNDQVYKSDKEMKAIWKDDYSWKLNKIAKAVIATKGEIITYNQQPITAFFFSTSNGYTENSEAYWKNAAPYLKSVASPWDKASPKFADTKIMTLGQFQKKLGINLKNKTDIGQITGRTPGKRVASVSFGGKELTGKAIRERLELKSTDFTWKRKGNNIIITTKGYGHGVGMSQYGANGMAKEGKTYKEIIEYYYQNVQIASADPVVNKIVARK
ncbi:stage II sporulation protein D [Bacillus testis]|uniref:stage II sporulation protein D n=1 Tax=Bacillus testis TaxID=1622072 RepID=UPI000ABEB75E|nr:stage II sporulation protein D [Bacillus testis]